MILLELMLKSSKEKEKEFKHTKVLLSLVKTVDAEKLLPFVRSAPVSALKKHSVSTLPKLTASKLLNVVA